MFHSVWVHLGPFHYCMKLDAKWAEMVQLMQNFAPRSCVWIFCNECTRSTPLDTKLMFCFSRSVWVHFCLFRCFTLLGSKRAELLKLMHKFKPQSGVRIFCNKSTLSTPCFGAFHSVWVHLGPFRYCMKLGAKWVEVVQLIQKFMPRSRVRYFHNECTQCTPLDLKLIYCHVS